MRVAEVVLDGVGHEHEDLLALVQQQHEREVADALLGVPCSGDELEALHLPEVRGVPHHVDVHELRDVAVPVGGVLVLEGVAKGPRSPWR